MATDHQQGEKEMTKKPFLSAADKEELNGLRTRWDRIGQTTRTVMVAQGEKLWDLMGHNPVPRGAAKELREESGILTIKDGVVSSSSQRFNVVRTGGLVNHYCLEVAEDSPDVKAGTIAGITPNMWCETSYDWKKLAENQKGEALTATEWSAAFSGKTQAEALKDMRALLAAEKTRKGALTADKEATAVADAGGSSGDSTVDKKFLHAVADMNKMKEIGGATPGMIAVLSDLVASI